MKFTHNNSDKPQTITLAPGEFAIVDTVGKPTPSASGKTKVVFSSRGNIKTGVMIDGKEVTLGYNGYIPAG